jgi:hypothetical protein
MLKYVLFRSPASGEFTRRRFPSRNKQKRVVNDGWPSRSVQANVDESRILKLTKDSPIRVSMDKRGGSERPKKLCSSRKGGWCRIFVIGGRKETAWVPWFTVVQLRRAMGYGKRVLMRGSRHKGGGGQPRFRSRLLPVEPL